MTVRDFESGGNLPLLLPVTHQAAITTSAESQRLFELIDRLKGRGATLIYVSHRLEEIFRLCESVTVLRDGQHIETSKTAGFSIVSSRACCAPTTRLPRSRGSVKIPVIDVAAAVSGLTR